MSIIIHKIIKITLFACCVLFLISPFAYGLSESNNLENLRVSFWPEYDHKDPQKSVLVIYRGNFSEGTELPAQVKFPIPKGSEVLAATSVDPSGRLINRSYNLEPSGDLDELVYNVDSLEFQFEFYNFPTGSTKKRKYSFPIRLLTAVKTLHVEIQKPLEATGFTIEPPSSNITSRKEQSNRSFDYHNYVVKDLSPNSSVNFEVSYNKPDTKPSVDIQLGAVTNFSNSRSRLSSLIPVIISVLIILFVAIFIIAKRFRTPSKLSFGKSFKVSDHVKIKDDDHKGFCIECGQPLKKGEKYCSSCGSDV